MEVWGAQGGWDRYKLCKGGYAKGEIYLARGTVCYVMVGGRGLDGSDDRVTLNNKGGWNGGGASEWGGSGGGATDVRLKPESETSRAGSTEWNFGMYQRIIVAGGGGGNDNNQEGTHGGSGGGIRGGSGSGENSPNHVIVENVSPGGTQTSGYAFGRGGDGIGGSDTPGGGGGWYGGYPGLNRGHIPSNNCGAGGGSGYVGGMGRNTSMNNNVNPGNGYARIYLIEW